MPFSPISVAAAVAAPLVGSFFAAADAALTSLSTARVSAMLEQSDLEHRSALERYQKNPYFISATCVVGRVICTALTAVVVAEMTDALLPGRLDTLLSIPATVMLVAPIFDAAVSIAERRAATWAGRLATYLRPFELLFWPLAAPLAAISRWLVKRFEPVQDDGEKSLLSAEVGALVDEVEKSGVVGAEPAEMIRNVLEFEDLRASDVMIPRTRIEGIDARMPLDKVRELVADSGHSRYPVYENELDNVVGLLCAKDVFKLGEGEGKKQRLGDVVRKDVIFVHELQSLASLLREMRSKRQHMAVVVDEFGATSGLITLEDVIERIVGDIRDEHDEQEGAPIQDLGNGRLVADTTVSMGDLSAYLGTSIPDEARREPLARVLDEEKLPIEVGRTIEKWGLVFIVRDMTGSRVERLEVLRPENPA